MSRATVTELILEVGKAMILEKSEYQQRKDSILGFVINEYIKNTAPVSSSYIAHEHFRRLSSATIRNILAELEAQGYLTHPHTSAGRIPTEEGYRYYVDHLMREIQLLKAEKDKIKKEYEKNVRDLEFILEKTSEVIAGVTHYTAIVSVDGRKDQLFCRGTEYVVAYPLSEDLRTIKKILSVLEKKERILEVINRDLQNKIQIYIGHETACAAIEECSLAVSKYKFDNGLSGRIAVLGPTRMNYQRVVSALDYVSEYMKEIL